MRGWFVFGQLGACGAHGGADGAGTAMVRAMRIAALQFDIAWMDPARNWATIDRLAASANLSAGDFVLILQELSKNATVSQRRGRPKSSRVIAAHKNNKI